MTSNEAELVTLADGSLATPEQAHEMAVGSMAPIDALPPPFRKLVYEYGRNVTLALVESGTKDEQEAEFQLASMRWQRQEQWLKTDYIPPGTRLLTHDTRRPRRARAHPAGARSC